MRKNKYLLITLAIVGLIISISGITYAYLRVNKNQENSNDIASLKCLGVDFENETSAISLKAAYPLSYTEGMETSTYNFKITNKCDTSIVAKVNLETLSLDNLIDRKHIRVWFNNDNLSSPKYDLLTNFSSETTTISNAVASNNLMEVYLNEYESETFELRLWIDEATTWEEGKNTSYAGKITISVSPNPNAEGTKSDVNAPKGWDTAESGTLLAAIKNNYPTATATLTTPGEQISTEDEAVLAATKDDYGISYYFRGAVTNNYVQFANKCWRIVRVTGDGSIKLVLHNDNVNNVSSPCAASNNSESAAFVEYGDYGFNDGEFNTSYDKNAYVGFMYGTAGSSTYALEHENKNESAILTNLKTWYYSLYTNLNSSDNKLADTIWCNDKSTYKNTSYDPFNIGTIGTNYGIGENINYYSATSRIVSSSRGLGSAATGISPTLVCPNDDNGGNLSKYTSFDTINGNGALYGYEIGLLTADEIVFAGGGYMETNTTYYLYENASGNFWWTLSPSSFYFNAEMFTVSLDGSVYVWPASSTGTGLRPAVSLISSITISSGNGTSSNPFVIN